MPLAVRRVNYMEVIHILTQVTQPLKEVAALRSQ